MTPDEIATKVLEVHRGPTSRSRAHELLAEAARTALAETADAIQALHPNEEKASVAFIRRRYMTDVEYFDWLVDWTQHPWPEPSEPRHERSR